MTMNNTRAHRFHRAFTVLAAACLVAVLGAGCGSSDEAAAGAGGASASAGAAGRYGYGPSPNSAFVYQPDVIIIGGGGAAIRSASSDGLVWTIDAHALGASDLAIGKIMFATADSVGRVIKLEPRGDDLAVTLAPVELTDILLEGQLQFDKPINFDAMSFQTIPDLPGQMSDPSVAAGAPAPATGGVQTMVVPTLRLLADPAAGSAGMLPASEQAAQKAVKVGDWDLTAYKSSSKVGLKAEYAVVAGLKVGADVHLEIENLHITGGCAIHNGIMDPSSNIQIDGIKGIAIQLAAGAAQGLSDNRKIRLELPIEISEPIIILGFPAVLKQKFSFIVETAFSAKNGNLSASGAWKLDGPIGIRGSEVLVPAFSVEKSILESLEGVSVGVNGIIVAMSFRFSVGVGVPAVNAGPHVSLIASTALTKGSSVGIVDCRQSTLTMTVKGGANLTVPTPVRTAIDAILDQVLHGTKLPVEKDFLTKDIVKSTQYTPMIEACKLTPPP
jgi:hypothetical protein